jgi:hypothetical protein
VVVMGDVTMGARTFLGVFAAWSVLRVRLV